MVLYRTGPKSGVVKECMYERINERERPQDVYEGEGWIGPEASSWASYILLILSARNKQPERGKGTGCKTYLCTIKQMDLRKLLCIARCGCCGIGKELVATYLTARQAWRRRTGSRRSPASIVARREKTSRLTSHTKRV